MEYKYKNILKELKKKTNNNKIRREIVELEKFIKIAKLNILTVRTINTKVTQIKNIVDNEK